MSVQSSKTDQKNRKPDEELKEKALQKFRAPVTITQQARDDASRHTDADNIRRHFSIPAWDREEFSYQSVVPNCFEHTWDAPLDEDSGGTDALVRGKPGSGKSTLANYLAVRMMDINHERVVWRGSSSRSEWLPLAPWTRLCLPKGVPISARLESKDPRKPAVELEPEELERIVRTVVRYEDPVDLNQNHLKEGAFHVVYPDPRMRGCQRIYEESPERTYEAPSGRDALFSKQDPASHWWFAWVLARVENGPHHWTSLIFDEVGDIAPQSAKKDKFGTYQKVEMLKDTWVDARKFGLSIFCFGHSETDIHQMIRKKLRWRIQMRGTANPTTKSDLVGFESVPMDHDQTSGYDIDRALMYTETNFEDFRFTDMPTPHDYKLRLQLG